jgi:hypothetical protein
MTRAALATGSSSASVPRLATFTAADYMGMAEASHRAHGALDPVRGRCARSRCRVAVHAYAGSSAAR